jgi:hypothetical protein
VSPHTHEASRQALKAGHGSRSDGAKIVSRKGRRPSFEKAFGRGVISTEKKEEMKKGKCRERAKTTRSLRSIVHLHRNSQERLRNRPIAKGYGPGSHTIGARSWWRGRANYDRTDWGASCPFLGPYHRVYLCKSPPSEARYPLASAGDEKGEPLIFDVDD